MGPSPRTQGSQQGGGTSFGNVWVVTRGKAKKEADFSSEPSATDDPATSADPTPAADLIALLEGVGEPIPPLPL